VTDRTSTRSRQGADLLGAPPPARRRRVRVALRVLVFAVLAFLLLLALALIPALRARSHLAAGERAMEEGQDELVEGDLAAASERFQAARERFSDASGSAGSPLLLPLSWTPVLGRSADVLGSLAEAGVDLADAGVVVADALQSLPGGLDALAPRQGRFPIEQVEQLAPALAEAAGLAEAGLREIRSTAPTLLLPPVVEARREAMSRVGRTHRLLRTAWLIADGLPAFLGAKGERRYFFGAQNPAELRGTGGIMGAYSILSIDRGLPRFAPFRPIQSLPDIDPDDVMAPSDEYRRNYDVFGGAGFWLNSNMTPHFPWAAQALLASYEVATGTALDGAIVADPFALKAMLEVTGPVDGPGDGPIIGPKDVVPYTANRAYRQFEDPERRKRVLGDVAKAVFVRFLAHPGGSVESLERLAEAASEGHILVYSTDPRMQEGLAATGSGGAFGARHGDFVAVVENNGAANKLDFYTERETEYLVELGRDGAARSELLVRFENEAPDSGQPRYVMGPRPGISAAGEIRPILRLFCGRACRIASARRDGTPIDPLHGGTELGHPFLQEQLDIRSGGSGSLGATFTTDAGWEGDDSGGTYRLTLLTQTTIRRPRLRVEIVAPEGMSIVEASVRMDVSGPTAIWEGSPPRRLVLEVRFRPPTLVRYWRNVLRLLDRPVVRIDGAEAMATAGAAGGGLNG
jgi:hypothetical protein